MEAFAAGVADDVAQLDMAVDGLLDAADLRLGVAGGLQFAGDVGEGAHQGGGSLVESSRALRTMPASRSDTDDRVLSLADSSASGSRSRDGSGSAFRGAHKTPSARTGDSTARNPASVCSRPDRKS